MVKASKRGHPPLETPTPELTETMAVFANIILELEASLDAYPGWQQFMRRQYEFFWQIFGPQPEEDTVSSEQVQEFIASGQ